jgi:hypothetical protein
MNTELPDAKVAKVSQRTQKKSVLLMGCPFAIFAKPLRLLRPEVRFPKYGAQA